MNSSTKFSVIPRTPGHVFWSHLLKITPDPSSKWLRQDSNLVNPISNNSHSCCSDKRVRATHGTKSHS